MANRTQPAASSECEQKDQLLNEGATTASNN